MPMAEHKKEICKKKKKKKAKATKLNLVSQLLQKKLHRFREDIQIYIYIYICNWISASTLKEWNHSALFKAAIFFYISTWEYKKKKVLLHISPPLPHPETLDCHIHYWPKLLRNSDETGSIVTFFTV